MKFDPTVVFYLKNQRLIDEWHALSEQIPDHANRFFASLADPLREAASDLPGDAQLFSSLLDDTHPKLFFVKASWLTSRGKPRMGIGLEWKRATVDFLSAYSGLWTNRDSKENRTVSNALRAAFRDHAAKHGYDQRHWWTLFHRETPTGDYWDDLDPFRDQVVASLCDQWNNLHAKADTLFAEALTQKS